MFNHHSVTPSQINRDVKLSIWDAQVIVNQLLWCKENGNRCNGEAKTRQPPQREFILHLVITDMW